MEYREIEALTLDDAKFKIRKEYGDRARIIKVMETAKGGFLGFGKKKNVKVLISIPDIELLKKFKENMGIKSIQKEEPKDEPIQFSSGLSYTNSMEQLLEKLNNIESELVRNKKDSASDNLHSNLIELKQILKENEFFDEFIDIIINKIKEELPYSKIEDRVEVHNLASAIIKEKIIIPEDLSADSTDKKVIVLVGPTGVGKTTTIAKIAANLIRDKKKVELITIDGYRIGAKYQLKKYAEYMHVPMSGAEENLELQKIIDLSDADVVLIDTIGRSAQDELNLIKMKQLLKIERIKAEFILTVSASVKVSELKRIFKNFNVFDYKNMIITKLDETETVGGIINIAIDNNCGIRYLTNGQKVPNDIYKAEKDNLIQKITGLDSEVYFSSVS